MPLALDRGRIPEFVRSPPTIAVYDVAHSLPLGGIGRGLPFTEDETRRHFSFLSSTFREWGQVLNIKMAIPPVMHYFGCEAGWIPARGVRLATYFPAIPELESQQQLGQSSF